MAKNSLEISRDTWSNPFRQLMKMQTDMERLMEDFGSPRTPNVGAIDLAPSCELGEQDGNYIFKTDMPGVKKTEIKIELDGTTLVVSAERKHEKHSEDKKTHYSEISYGSYFRSITLPSKVDEKKVQASFEDGVLTITLPKAESKQAKQISVQ